jgi:hypothetical protein
MQLYSSDFTLVQHISAILGHHPPSPCTITRYKNDRLYTTHSHNIHSQGTGTRVENITRTVSKKNIVLRKN